MDRRANTTTALATAAGGTRSFFLATMPSLASLSLFFFHSLQRNIATGMRNANRVTSITVIMPSLPLPLLETLAELVELSEELLSLDGGEIYGPYPVPVEGLSQHRRPVAVQPAGKPFFALPVMAVAP